MKRRGFLGFMGGAAVAGPQVAKNAIRALPSGIGGAMPVPSLDRSIPATAGGSDWRLDEIARLKRLISGELSEDEIEEKKHQRLYSLDPLVTQNVMALQSVSPQRKLAIYGERMAVIRDEIDRLYHKRRLRDYLKEIGR